MNDMAPTSRYGSLIEPATVKLERLLPGPIDRIWSYLTDGEMRRKWLASGPMDLRQDGSFELVWRNDELTDPVGERPPGFPEEHRLEGRITEIDPPRRLVISWGKSGGVSFDLEPSGRDVLLTVTHHRLPDRDTLLMVSAGWHAHLDILADRLTGGTPAPFWDTWRRLKNDYAQRLPE